MSQYESSRDRDRRGEWIDARVAWRALLTTVLVLAVAGCRDRGSQPEIETVDVEPGLEIDTTTDPQARDAQPRLAGILPGDFPEDLPLYVPASLIDFGESSAGRSTVSLLSPHSVPRVRRELYARLREKGWSTSAGSSGTVVLEKGRRRAWLRLEDGQPGTRYRFEY